MIGNIHIASSADDNTPYSVENSQYDLETKLQKTSVKLFKWFHENGMKANQDKCHFLSNLNPKTIGGGVNLIPPSSVVFRKMYLLKRE